MPKKHINATKFCTSANSSREPNATYSGTVTYFSPDTKKIGGNDVTVFGNVKALNESKCAIIMVDGTKIPAEDARYGEGIYRDGKKVCLPGATPKEERL